MFTILSTSSLARGKSCYFHTVGWITFNDIYIDQEKPSQIWQFLSLSMGAYDSSGLDL